MKTTFTGTVVNGALKLDQRVELADESRVFVTVVAVEDTQRRWGEALEALERLRREHPIDSGGLRYTRDELHERR
jgi:hypothetical protein